MQPLEANVLPLVGSEDASPYVICSNPRSGSWLLSEGLYSTRLAGNPREWFNDIAEEEQRELLRKRDKAEPTEMQRIAFAFEQSTTANGICCLKLLPDQFARLPKKVEAIGGQAGLDPGRALVHLLGQPKCIWLTRRDKSKQAISLRIASLTKEWWSIDGISARKDNGRQPDLKFDGRAIARLERSLIENDVRWKVFFRSAGISPHVVWYEDLTSDYEGTLRGVLDWLEIDGAEAIAIPPARLKKQSTELNDEWLTRYLEYKQRSGLFGAEAAPENQPVPDLPEPEVTRSVPAMPPKGAAPSLVTHSFRLRPDLEVQVALPADLSDREAQRLARFIEALPL